MAKILIAEDEPAINDLIKWNLELVGHTCHQVFDGRAALEAAGTGGFDLLILDVMMPALSGFEIMPHLKGQPVIFVTAKAGVQDRLRGLQLGADDYITKPFSLAVLRARVNAQLRRNISAKPACTEIDDFQFDFDRMEFRKDGQLVELSKTEQKLLRILVENRGQTLPRAVLVDRIWTDGAEYVDENALSVTVKRLRDKLEDTPSSPKYLKTVYGIGYTWAVK